MLIPVSLRSLNTLGNNGFDRQSGARPRWDWRGARIMPFWPALAPAFARAWWVWNLEFFGEALDNVRRRLWPRKPAGVYVPTRAIPAEARPRGPKPDKEAQFEAIYGAGFSVNRDVLDALAQAGWHLRAAGVTVLYFVSPLQTDEIGRETSPEVRRQLDAADRQVDRFFADQGFPVLDLHGSVQRGYFESPSEHLDGPGRKKVAAALLDWLSSRLGGVPAAAGHGLGSVD